MGSRAGPAGDGNSAAPASRAQPEVAEGVIRDILLFQDVLVLGNPQNSLDNPQNSLVVPGYPLFGVILQLALQFPPFTTEQSSWSSPEISGKCQLLVKEKGFHWDLALLQQF